MSALIRPLLLLATFLSATLLFVVQPLYAKHLLPFFGGTSSVWTISIFFYSATLLLGYLYAAVLMSWPLRLARLVHGSLLLVTAGLLLWRWIMGDSPVLVDAVAQGAPAVAVLLTLTFALGLPILLLASTTVITQKLWGNLIGTEPYPLYAVSNAGSLLGLLLYPFLLEPYADLTSQATGWLLLYLCFNLLLLAAWQVRQRERTPKTATATSTGAIVAHRWSIILLAAIPTFLLASVTELLSRGVASFPLLWVVPLALYLLSFIFIFGRVSGFLARIPLGFFVLLSFLPTLVLLPLMNFNASFYWLTSLYILVTFFLLALYFHRRVHELRPPVADLGPFYVYLTLGGAIGSGVVGFILPLILSTHSEVFLAFMVLTIFFAWRYVAWLDAYLPVRITRVTAGGVVFLALLSTGVMLHEPERVTSERNFFGTVRVVDSTTQVDGQTIPIRTIVHGTTNHGMQALDPAYEEVAASYYGPNSGIDLSLRYFTEADQSPRVSVIGLGAGMMNAYCDDVAQLDYIEINPAVVKLARAHFTYLEQCPDRTQVEIGDGRLALAEAAADQSYDVIMMDAFTDDAIPVHLLTLDAFAEAYAPHLSESGIVAFHISNKYLNLAPPIAGIGQTFGYVPLLVQNDPGEGNGLYHHTTWVLLVPPHVVDSLLMHEQVTRYEGPALTWTDERSSVLEVLSLTGSAAVQ